jgi:lipopolysaccharide transport system ATP-binding protein
MKEPIIAFEHVSKRYPLYHHLQGGFKNFLLHLPGSLSQLRESSFVALDDVDFRVGAGETLGIIGRNGAGKSTILGLTAGVLRPSAGRVRVRRRPFPLLELGAGFHPDFTAAENVVLNGMLLGKSRRHMLERLGEIIAFAEIGEFADQPVRTFSSGMVARLGFAVVTHLQPELLLIDEVLAVGDLRFQEKCLSVLESFRKRGCTILLVSHQLEDVERVCDRVVWMEKGRVQREGGASEMAGLYAASNRDPSSL